MTSRSVPRAPAPGRAPEPSPVTVERGKSSYQALNAARSRSTSTSTTGLDAASLRRNRAAMEIEPPPGRPGAPGSVRSIGVAGAQAGRRGPQELGLARWCAGRRVEVEQGRRLQQLRGDVLAGGHLAEGAVGERREVVDPGQDLEPVHTADVGGEPGAPLVEAGVERAHRDVDPRGRARRLVRQHAPRARRGRRRPAWRPRRRARPRPASRDGDGRRRVGATSVTTILLGAPVTMRAFLLVRSLGTRLPTHVDRGASPGVHEPVMSCTRTSLSSGDGRPQPSS